MDAARAWEQQAFIRGEGWPAHQAAEPRPEGTGNGHPRKRVAVGREERLVRGAQSEKPLADPLDHIAPEAMFTMMRMIAGPRMTMNIDGKMQPTSGKRILIEALLVSS